MKPIDEIGNRYGELVVVGRAGSTKWGKATWVCKCARCGREKTALGSELRSGHTRNCGNNGSCRSPLLPDGVAKNLAIRGVKKNETSRNYPFELSDEYATLLIESQCYYCGALPINQSKNINGYEDYLYNGIDRYDNEPFLREDNAVPCCAVCNRAKSNVFMGDEFKAWRQRLGPTNYD